MHHLLMDGKVVSYLSAGQVNLDDVTAFGL